MTTKGRTRSIAALVAEQQADARAERRGQSGTRRERGRVALSPDEAEGLQQRNRAKPRRTRDHLPRGHKREAGGWLMPNAPAAAGGDWAGVVRSLSQAIESLPAERQWEPYLAARLYLGALAPPASPARDVRAIMADMADTWEPIGGLPRGLTAALVAASAIVLVDRARMVSGGCRQPDGLEPRQYVVGSSRWHELPPMLV